MTRLWERQGGPAGSRAPQGPDVEVEEEDVHARLAEEAEEAPLRPAGDERLEVGGRDARLLRDARDLPEREVGGDVRIEARARGGDGVGRDGALRAGVLGAGPGPPPPPGRRAPSTSGRGSTRPRRAAS